MEKSTDKVVNIEDRGLKYRVRVLIKHPSEDLDRITRETGITPRLLFTKGKQRFAPNGTALPGTHEASTWSYWQDTRDSRAFSQGIEAMLDALAPARDSINRLRNTGGHASLILELEGERNISDAIERRDLTRLTEIGFDLGIEVYPEGF